MAVRARVGQSAIVISMGARAVSVIFLVFTGSFICGLEIFAAGETVGVLIGVGFRRSTIFLGGGTRDNVRFGIGGLSKVV